MTRERVPADSVVVTGTVVDTTGAGIGGAEVTLVETGGTTATQATGWFRLAAPAPGPYSLWVRRIGYQARVRTVTVAGSRTVVEPIVLVAAPQELAELRVEGRVSRPTFNLHPTTYIERVPLTRFGKHPSNLTVLDTRGASLSPMSMVVVRSVTWPGLAIMQAWAKDAGGAVTDFQISVLGCPRPGDPVMATGWRGWSDTVRVLDRSGRIWKHQLGWVSRGRCIQTSAAPAVGTIVNAGAVAGGWVVVRAEAAGRCRVQYQGDDGRQYWQLPAARLGSDCAGLTRAHITPIAGGAAVSLPDWPFTWFRIDLSGRVSPPSAAAPDLSSRERYRGWVGLGVLDLGKGFVQSLMSPGGRDREIVVYDRAGRAVMTTERSGAPALIACDPVHRRLAGLRFTSAGVGRSEIVIYEY